MLRFWELPIGIANVAAFLLLALLIDGLVSMIVLLSGARLRPPPSVSRPWFRTMGTIPAGLHSLVLAGYFASLVLALPIEHPVKVAVRDSTLGPVVAGLIQSLGIPTDQLVQPALNDISQLFTVEPGSKEFVTLPFKASQPTLCAADEQAMISMVNDERRKRGIGIVVPDIQLRSVARSHSLDMFRRGYFSHYTPEGADPFDRMDRAGIVYQAAGENLALAPTLQAAHTGLMNSPGHKRNILDPHFHKLGVGCYQSPRYGMMFSQEFSN
jgi:uncharacterized protein YkwD